MLIHNVVKSAILGLASAFYFSSCTVSLAQGFLKLDELTSKIRESVLLFGLDKKVVGGTKIPWTSAQWQVAIFWGPALPDIIRAYRCGGALLKDTWVVTAGHCVEGIDAADQVLDVLSGTADLRDVTQTGAGRNWKKIRASKIYLFPGYSNNPLSDPVNDIALIKLSSAAVGTSISYLPSAEEISFFSKKQTLQTSGWGKTEKGVISYELRKVNVNIIAADRCGYSNRVLPMMFCAGDDGRDACDHDSGGPTINGNRLIGIVSWGTEHCGTPGKHGVYTNVAKFSSWIEKCMRDETTCKIP